MPLLRHRGVDYPYKDHHSDTLMSTGTSMLVPLPYEPMWTRLDDGIFNDAAPAIGSPVHRDGLDPDTTVGQVVPIPLNVQTNTAVLPANARRGYLLIENNSTATAPDTAPTLFVNYDGPVPPSAIQSLVLNKAIPAGSGLVLDRRCPSNAIYVRWGPFVNGGLTAVVGGVVEQGLLPIPQGA